MCVFVCALSNRHCQFMYTPVGRFPLSYEDARAEFSTNFAAGQWCILLMAKLGGRVLVDARGV